ncbi:hypothetical protein [Alkalicoccus daliensis]|uniref:Uncharacterized protein n=1 Tax=Alkalicoccus daliensis TaxID=745820 RepID=A0A1H0CZS8_9BACI|nr:hypothetical protein [Alkalicoccus daliensis]SDN63368.1 hypothetical protein SAMN04488053_102290 [Alkalicoccus daliensis]
MRYILFVFVVFLISACADDPAASNPEATKYATAEEVLTSNPDADIF